MVKFTHMFKNHQQAVPTKVKRKMHTLFRDHQQVTFIMLNRFCQLSNFPLPLPPAFKRQFQPKSKERYMPFLHCISNFEHTSDKNI